ncbi:MAG: HlyD family efflux transporter periplasmic adaptor subunit, partial [Bacteroidota bacterium]|nr:HlyD family efflux transporter periplasmic adaptor subunit [Bacteroidota bacterium]
ATASKRSGFKAQMAVYQEQKKTAKTNFDRFSRMYAEGASTRKQVDDLEGQLMVIDRQMETVKTQFTSLDKEIEVVNTQLAQLNDLQNRSAVKSPISGIVLERYHRAGEMVNPGAALFKLGDLSYLTLRVYVSGAQLSHVNLNQKVKVLIDQDAKSNQTLEGIVTWISPEAEFTPKIIQTKEERVKQVYAVKVKVRNDGRLKIGMPGEIKFQ